MFDDFLAKLSVCIIAKASENKKQKPCLFVEKSNFGKKQKLQLVGFQVVILHEQVPQTDDSELKICFYCQRSSRSKIPMDLLLACIMFIKLSLYL